MPTAADVIAVARSQIGYVEGGGNRDGNITKYWSELDPGLQGQSWCACFVSWCFKHAGAPLPRMDRGYGFMNCASAVHYARANGIFSQSGHYAPGDIVLYGSGGGDHTGIVVADDGVTITAIEGNTSSGNGQDTNGGGVYLTHRPHSSWVFGVMQASKLLGKSSQASPIPPIFSHAPGSLVVDGVMGPATVTALQRWVGAPADGSLGPITVRALQRKLGVAQDGVWGVQTWAALNRRTGERPGGPGAIRVLQAFLNHSGV